MDKKSLDKNSSIEWLKSGKILIHPTESIWGFGCDAFNESAVNKIFEIKARTQSFESRIMKGKMIGQCNRNRAIPSVLVSNAVLYCP